MQPALRGPGGLPAIFSEVLVGKLLWLWQPEIEETCSTLQFEAVRHLPEAECSEATNSCSERHVPIHEKAALAVSFKA